MIHHRSPISGVATHGDRFVATAGYDNQVVLWNARTGEAMARSQHDHLANQCAFSRDGARLVSASSDYTARIWSVPDMRLTAVLGDHEDDVEMAVFHPTRDLIATASRDRRVRVFSGDGRLVHRFEGHAADALSVEWVAGTTDLITSGDDGTIRRWSLTQQAETERFDLGGVETDTVVVTQEGVVYAGTDDGEIVVFAGGAKVAIPAHAAGIKRLAHDAETSVLVSLSYDRMVRTWRCVSGGLALLDEAAMPSDVWARSCAFGGGSTLVFGTFGSKYRTYDYKAKTWGAQPDPTFGVNAVAAVDGDHFTIGDAGLLWRNGEVARSLGSLCNFLLPAAGRLLTGGQMGILFEANSGRSLHQHRSPLNCAAAYRVEGEDRVVVGAYTGEGLIFALPDDGDVVLRDVVQLHANAIKGIAVSDGRIFSVCADASCAWHDAATHREILRRTQAHGKIANGCAALKGGGFVSISRDLKLRVWRDGEAEIIPTPHANSIKCIACDAQGRLVATGSYGGHVGVFDLEAMQWVSFSRPSACGISNLCYDDRHGRFLASSYDGAVYRIERPDHA